MKSIIKKFINIYGVNKVYYGIIVYGVFVIRVVDFNSIFFISVSDLKMFIDK